MSEVWIPGQPTTYHPEGAVRQHPSGQWYVRRDGKWRLMTEEEVRVHLAKEESK